MEIDLLQSLAPAAPEVAQAPDALGRDEFLQMLIAQLENQDPLNPQDSTEFTAQLAQFSSLEQLFKIDEGIQALANNQSNVGLGIDALASASVLGREVTLSSDQFEVADTPVTRPGFELTEAADAVRVRVFDARDQPIGTIASSRRNAGTHFLTDEEIQQVAPSNGVYRFEVEAESAGNIREVATVVQGTVQAAIPLGDEPRLSIGSLSAPYSAVREIRSAQRASE